MEGIYYFGDQVRWNLGFINPNIAGAFIAMILAFILPFSGRFAGKGVKNAVSFILFLALEIPLWITIAKTYSRGALVAALTCVVVYAAISLFRGDRIGKVLTVLASRLVSVLIILISTGFIQRTSPSYLASDGSVSARTALWQGGLKMVTQAPLEGWGAGNSGKEYINWYQDIDDERKYAGMVNSYLYIAVERGLPVLFFLLFTSLFFCISGMSKSDKVSDLFRTGGALGILSYIILNIFSTLIVFHSLLMLLTAFLGVVVISNIAECQWRRFLAALPPAFVISILMCFGILCAGYMIDDGSISKRDGFLALSAGNNNASALRKIAIFPDDDTLGLYYGKELRRALHNIADKNIEFIVFNPDAAIEEEAIPSDIHTAILMGKASKNLESIKNPNRRVFLVNPVGTPPQGALCPERIFLPMLDIYNQNPRWTEYANRHKIAIEYLDGVSNRITEHAFMGIIQKTR